MNARKKPNKIKQMRCQISRIENHIVHEILPFNAISSVPYVLFKILPNCNEKNAENLVLNRTVMQSHRLIAVHL